MKDKGWKSEGGPCDGSTKTLAVGVGAMKKDAIAITRSPMLAGTFKLAWKSGRVERFALDT